MNISPLREAVIYSSQFNFDQPAHYTLDLQTSWVHDLLEEISENASKEFSQQQEKRLILDFHFSKKQDKALGAVLTLDLGVQAKYATICVNSLEEFLNQLNFKESLLFLPPSYKQDSRYKEETEIDYKDKTYQLYILENNKIPISEIVHEQIYLNYDNFPRKAPIE